MTPEAMQGVFGPTYEVDIERGKIREFARAMDAPLAEYMEVRNPVIPAMFLVSAPYGWGYTLERPRGTLFEKIEHDLSVPLHAEEAFSFHGALPKAGDRLFAKTCLESVSRKQGKAGGNMTFLVMLTEYRDEADQLRAEQRSTTVTVENAPQDGKWEATPPVYDPDCSVLERPGAFSMIKPQAFDELVVGQPNQPIELPTLTIHDIVRFQGVVGEDNPLHFDAVWAKKQGYPQVFALGTHQASQMAAYSSYWLGVDVIRRFRVRFRSIGWPGDRFTICGKIIEKNEKHKTAQAHLTCTRENGDLINEAWLEFDFSK